MKDLKYEKLIVENKLSERDLPKYILAGINEVKKKMKAVVMREKGGKNVTPNQLEGLEYSDSRVSKDIEEYIAQQAQGNSKKEAEEKAKRESEEKEQAEKRAKEAAAEEEEKKKKQADDKKQTESASADPKGLEVENELAKLFKDGKGKLAIEEFKKHAPVSYSIIFDSYVKGEPNGVCTTRYQAIEENEQITISKL